MSLTAKRGFTLIELLVVMAITVLIAGGIVANYDKYNNSQRLKQAALSLKNDLRLAQNRALSGQKPLSGCSELIGYYVTFTLTSYTIGAQCLEGSVGEVVTVTLPSAISFSALPSPILFGVLTRGIASDVTLTLVGFSRSYALGISRSGDINDLGFQ